LKLALHPKVSEDAVLELITKPETGSGSITCAPKGLESVLPFPLTAVSVNGPYDAPYKPDTVCVVAPELIKVIVPRLVPDKVYDD